MSGPWVEALGDDGRQLQWLRHEDQRARLMIDLVRSWSATHILSDAMAGIHDQPHKKVERSSIETIVFMAADMAEATFDEIQRRGWQLELRKKEDTP